MMKAMMCFRVNAKFTQIERGIRFKPKMKFWQHGDQITVKFYFSKFKEGENYEAVNSSCSDVKNEEVKRMKI